MRTTSLTVALVVMLLAPGGASAAAITINETGLDAIFGQASFGSTPVDVRVLPSQVIVDPALLHIDNWFEMFFQLFLLNSSPAPRINAFFVDSLDDSSCGGLIPGLVGCGLIGGNAFVVESAPAAGLFGTTLVAHELGHTLSLTHVLDSTRLMNPVISSSLLPLLTAAEVATILLSPFVQMDAFGGSRFIELAPVLISATPPVPEPGLLLLVCPGLGAAILRQRRRAIPLPPAPRPGGSSAPRPARRRRL